MNCPVCNVALTMSERQGIEIDYCPQCRGVWLDRGELDKIIEKSVPPVPQGGRVAPSYFSPSQESSQHGHHEDDRDYDHHRKKKRRSFLSDLFD